MRILLIEDEPKTAAFLAKGLAEDGFAVEVARDGVAGAELAQSGAFDLLIVDVMLPQKDGWSVVRELRASGSRTPVLFLTARDRVEDRVKGLKLGADDYLVKPFAFSELLARVRSLLRRSTAPAAEEPLHVADLEIDTQRNRATRGGVPLNLTPKEFLLLAHLVRAGGEVVSRAQIVAHVWDIGFVPDTNVVDVVVRRMRAKVDDPFRGQAGADGARRWLCHPSRLKRARSVRSSSSSSPSRARSCFFAGWAFSTGSWCNTPSRRITRPWPTDCTRCAPICIAPANRACPAQNWKPCTRASAITYWVRVRDTSGALLAETPGMNALLSLPQHFPPRRMHLLAPIQPRLVRARGKLLALLTVPEEVAGRSYIIQLAQDRSVDEQFTKRFGLLVLAVLVGGSIISALIARAITRRGLRPLGEITRSLERTGPTHLHERVEPSAWPRELQPLAHAFDQMLDRLEDSFTRLSQFSADLAHELRTPVANLRGEAEVALTRSRSAEEYREVIESSVAECERLSAIIDNLLFLARAEAAQGMAERTLFDGRAAIGKNCGLLRHPGGGTPRHHHLPRRTDGFMPTPFSSAVRSATLWRTP